MIRTGVALLAVVALAALPATARAQVKKSGDVVKVSATADKPDDKGAQKITITIAIDKPYHLYANPVGQEDLASAQTVVTVTGKSKLEDVKIDYPKGKVQMDKVVGDFNIYEDKVTITANVRRAKGDTEPLKVKVKLQACTDKTCLLQDTVEVDVK
jgi:hypothetical protein